MTVRTFPSAPTILRWVLAVVSALTSLAVSVSAGFYLISYGAITSIIARPFNDLTKTAVDINVEQSRSLFQVTLLVLGALWGLIIAAQPRAPRIAQSDLPEIVMFVFANLLLVGSLFWHVLYLDSIADAYGLAASTCADVGKQCIPDVLDDQIHHLFKHQRALLIAGVIVSVLTLFSTHRLKARRDNAA